MTSEQDREVEQLFQSRLDDNYRRTDRMFAYLMVGQWLFAIVVSLWLSPYAWAGKAHGIHLHVQLAVFLGGTISAAPVLLAWLRPGWKVTRYVIAVAQMMWSALLIHLTGGRIETHFHVFGSLAFLAFYRDWRVLVPATVVVAADHMIRQALWPESVFGISNPESWRFLEHAGWVVFEDVFLVVTCLTSVAEMRKISAQQIAVERTEGVAREMEIASSIQTSILPRDIEVANLEISARMVPAERVGGDYYDVLPVKDGCWIAVGDVAGHGVRAGLAMMQAQAALSALVRHAPDAKPSELWSDLNHTFYDNVRNRLGHDEHMTMTLLRYRGDGSIELVGAHEEILIWRAASGTCEVVPIEGTWIGVSRTVKLDQRKLQLADGDVMVLYTDGIIEARDGNGKMVGLEPVQDVIVRDHDKPASEIRDEIFKLTRGVYEDDASVLVVRYRRRQDAAQAA